MAGPRLLSHTEIATAQACFARHAFAYTGHLTGGSTLRSRRTPRVLREGRAWGSAVARWHQEGDNLLAAVAAVEAMRAELDAAEDEMFQRGALLDTEERSNVETLLTDAFAHYVGLVEPLPGFTRLEHEIVVPIPSRTGARSSSRYRFQCFLDGWSTPLVDDQEGFIVEFKWRSKLSRHQQIFSSRQPRWYAWAVRKTFGIDIVGAYVEERLAEAPKPPRIVKARKKGEGIDGYTVSHAADQLTTGEEYLAACERFGVAHVPETLEALERRVWQQRVPIIFRPSELDEAGEELVSAAKLIRDLDSGELYPLRNAGQACNSCRFREICPEPDDELYVETLFERRTPKRLKETDGSDFPSSA